MTHNLFVRKQVWVRKVPLPTKMGSIDRKGCDPCLSISRLVKLEVLKGREISALPFRDFSCESDHTMTEFFNFDFPPFNLLRPSERDKFSEALDIGYFQEGEVLIEPNKDIQSLFILIKGIVHETQDGETLNVHGEHDVFGARWLIEGKRSSTFTVVEEALIYLLPAALFEDILKQNEDFHSFFFKSIRDKVNMTPARASSYTASPLLATPVQKVVPHPLSIAASAPMSDAARLMRDHATTSILVTDRPKRGMRF